MGKITQFSRDGMETASGKKVTQGYIWMKHVILHTFEIFTFNFQFQSDPTSETSVSSVWSKKACTKTGL